MSEKSVEQLYNEREARVLAAAACQPPDQIPVFGPFQKYPYQFAGVTFKEAMNDYARGARGLPQVPGLLPARRRLRPHLRLSGQGHGDLRIGRPSSGRATAWATTTCTSTSTAST